MKIAFATSREFAAGHPDDLEAARLTHADFCVWNDETIDWQRYDRVVIRSTWDYTLQLETFLEWSRRVGPQRLRNRPELVAFGADKRYLDELIVPTVPTTFVTHGERVPDLNGDVVIKPSVSAGARDTGRFSPARHDEARALIETIRNSGRAAMVHRISPRSTSSGKRPSSTSPVSRRTPSASSSSCAVRRRGRQAPRGRSLAICR
jgi:hypothetical protein